MPSVERFSDRGFRSTSPLDSTDLPRFGQLMETAKSVFKKELNDYFSYLTTDAAYKIRELPNIEKFGITTGSSTGNFQTAVEIILSNADKLDRFPMVAITTASCKEKKLSLGDNFFFNNQWPISLTTDAGPFNLISGDYITIRTWPTGKVESATDSVIVFNNIIFSSLTGLTATAISSRINETQALYYKFVATSSGEIRIEAGGKLGINSPNYIEIIAGSSNALSEFGLSVGEHASYLDTDNKVNRRYYISADMSINIDVISDDINTKQELADLIFGFFAFYMEQRRFEFIGRSYTDKDIEDEWFHMILENKFSWSSELARPRPGVEGYNYIYAVRGTVPFIMIDYLDRAITTEPRFLLRENIDYDDTYPVGDYFNELGSHPFAEE
jgi:hypothetical protein